MRFRFCVTSWWPACKMAPNELCLLAFTSLSRTPSYNESEQACVTVEYRRRYSVWLQKPGQKMHCSFCLGPLNLSIWGEPAMVLWEHSGGPCEEVHVESTKDFCSDPAPISWACEWATLNMDVPAPVKPSDNAAQLPSWLQPHGRSRVRTTLPIRSQISGPQWETLRDNK